MFGEFFILFALERGRPRDVGAGVEKLGVDGVDVRLEDGERAFNLVYDLRRVGRLLLQRASSFASLLFGQSLGVFRRVRRVGRIVACRRVVVVVRRAFADAYISADARLVRQRPVLDSGHRRRTERGGERRVVRDGAHGALPFAQALAQGLDGGAVEVIGRLVEE